MDFEATFRDGVSGREMTLVLGPEPLRPYDGKHGVRHPDCDHLADVSPDLDAFYCSECKWNGRISGAWFMDMWEAAAWRGAERGRCALCGAPDVPLRVEPPHTAKVCQRCWE